MENRREFLKKALKIGAVGAVAGATTVGAVEQRDSADSSGVVQGHSNKKEVLYWESKDWKKYYKIAY